MTLAEITCAEGVHLVLGPLGVADQVFVEHDAEIAGPLADGFQCRAAADQHVDHRDTFGIEQLEGEPQPLRRVPGILEGLGDVVQKVFGAADVAVLIAKSDAHVRESLLRFARTLGRFGGAPGEPLQPHIQGGLLDPGQLCRIAKLLQGRGTNPQLVRSLADGVGGRDRPVDQQRDAAAGGNAGDHTAQEPHAAAQARGTIAQAAESA